jgi:hypothetical protein
MPLGALVLIDDGRGKGLLVRLALEDLLCSARQRSPCALPVSQRTLDRARGAVRALQMVRRESRPRRAHMKR